VARATTERPVDRSMFERLLTGREFDLEDKLPATLAELESYAEATSSALFQAAVALSGVAENAASLAAREVGLGWALTGLLRALPFHARGRRLYLPHDMLAGAGLTADDVFEGRAGGRLAAVVTPIAARARDHLASARARRRDVPAEARSVMLPAVLADRHLRRLERAGYDPFAPQLQRPVPAEALRLAIANVAKRY
jgi:NADH dehydrogenase [ubiquinone] 1 alpha subcomplex assembly factor 6